MDVFFLFDEKEVKKMVSTVKLSFFNEDHEVEWADLYSEPDVLRRAGVPTELVSQWMELRNGVHSATLDSEDRRVEAKVIDYLFAANDEVRSWKRDHPDELLNYAKR